MPDVKIDRQGPVALLTMDPPGGFMTSETVASLAKALAGLEADDGVRAIVVTGARPGLFIRHFSVAELEAMARSLRSKAKQFSLERPVRERDIDLLFAAIAASPKPVIAAINGTAMGGGFELALACDIRIAEAGPYKLGLPEVRLGILPGAGGTQRLARIVGTARALEMALRGRTVSPSEARDLGLVQEVATSAQAAAMTLANDIASRPPRAVAHIKRLIRQDAAGPLDAGLSAERTLFLDLMTTEDALSLMSRFNAAGASLDEF